MANPLPQKTSPGKLNLPTKVAYGVGELGGEIPGNILVFFLLFFLTNVAGLNPTLAGSVLLIGKVWDAINDPMIGYLSDRTRSPLGRRYPWMLIGAIPLGIGFGLQWFVPPTSNQSLLFAYYGGIGILFYAAFTSVVLTHNALAAELTQGYDERIDLISFKASFSIGASIFSLGLAQIIFAYVDNPSQEYRILGTICAVVATLAVFLCVWGTYKRYKQIEAQRESVTQVSVLPITQQFRIAFSNFPFICVIGIYLCSWLSLQTTAAILPFFVTHWMGLPDHHFTQTALTVQGTALSMTFVWSAIAKRVGKRIIYCIGIPVTVCALMGLFFLQPNQVGLMYGLAVFVGLGLSTAYIVPWSMLPDVVDFDEFNTGQRREGIFYALVVQIHKIAVAIALFLVGKALDMSGFISSTSEQLSTTQPESALWTIRLLIGPIPAIVLMGGLAWAYFYPISRSFHGEILLKLIERRNTETLRDGGDGGDRGDGRD